MDDRAGHAHFCRRGVPLQAESMRLNLIHPYPRINSASIVEPFIAATGEEPNVYIAT